MQTVEIKDVAWGRGRNNGFTPKEVQVVKFRGGGIGISVWSRRTDGAAPIMLHLSPEEMKQVAIAILLELKGSTQ